MSGRVSADSGDSAVSKKPPRLEGAPSGGERQTPDDTCQG